MSDVARTIRTTPQSELALHIKHAEKAGDPVGVDTGERVYCLTITSSTRAESRSKRLKARLTTFAGVWRDLDGEELLKRLDQARHASPPSPPVKE
jgi:hypothetical protein